MRREIVCLWRNPSSQARRRSASRQKFCCGAYHGCGGVVFPKSQGFCNASVVLTMRGRKYRRGEGIWTRGNLRQTI